MISGGQDGTSAPGAAPPVVGIGASAGGLEAIREMLSAAEPPTGMALVVVQHLDPDHESLLAELLGRQTKLKVTQVEGGERCQADHVYIIPPGHGLAMEDGVLRLTPFSQPRGLRRPIDDFFVSLANDQQERAVCVILSGTGADGSLGLRAIKEHGGLCLVQEPETARYDGMPLSARNTGLVDFVLPPEEMLPRLTRMFFPEGREAASAGTEEVIDRIDDICRTLRDVIGHDFSGYKQTTLIRRVERRMRVTGSERVSDYLMRLRSDRDEAEALFRDLLINVTRFFRDPEYFERLSDCVVKPLIEELGVPGEAAGRDADGGAHAKEIRVWVPGCSSGEEAYSIAMLFWEEMRRQKRRAVVQIFATDIDDAMLELAREGQYLAVSMADIPAELRQRHTEQTGDVFRIAGHIRGMVRFSNHSLVKDPPFSRLDLVSCRNLFIYFGDKLQQSVLPVLHYAIRPGGFLFLGPSESLGRHEALFSVADQKARIFVRGDERAAYPMALPSGLGRPPAALSRASTLRNAQLDTGDVALRRLAERYAMPSVLVDPEGQILASHGRLGRYFEFSATTGGAVSVSRAARPGLREVLLPLVRQAVEDRARVVARDVEVSAEFGRQQADVIADPLTDGSILVVLRETAPFAPGEEEDLVEIGPADGQVQVLEDELRLTRNRLRDTVEELETANEELKSSNEEMMSMNEELQSTNEELSTVNDELKVKVDELSEANSDLKNFFESTQLAVVVLDRHLRIRSYTEAALQIFPLQAADRGRPLAQMASNLTSDDYMEAARAAAEGQETQQRLDSTVTGQAWALRAIPYQSHDGQIQGATLIFNDVTEALALQNQLDRERERLEMAVRVSGIGVWEYEIDSGRTVLDEAEKELFGVADDERPIGQMLDLIHPEDRPAVEESLRRAATGDRDFEATFRVQLPGGEERSIKGLGRTVPGSRPRRMIGVSFDVTADRRAVETRELMIREMNHRVKNLFAVIAAMVSNTARTATDTGAMAAQLRANIAALGRAHAVTHSVGGAGAANLKRLLDAVLEPYAALPGLRIAGPEVKLPSSALTPLALILHEWSTNAVKYGPLGTGAGRLEITWAMEDGGVLLDWRELHDQGFEAGPDAGGFGSRLVTISAQQLGATLDNGHDETSYWWQMRLPLQPQNEEDAEHGADIAG